MKFTTLMVVLCCLAGVSRAEDDVVIPPGVNYKKASAEVNEKATQKLRQVFSGKATDKEVLALFHNEVLICGPGMWNGIKNDPAMAKLTLGEVTFEMPVRDADGKVIRTDRLAGKLFQTPDEVLTFWRVFSAKADFSDPKIRKLNPTELQIYWSMISFDITEPVFMIETRQHKIVAQFISPDKFTVCWIDDFQEVSWGKKKDAEKPKVGK